MNTILSGANERHSPRPGTGTDTPRRTEGQTSLSAILSTPELRQLVAAMVD